MTRFKTTLLAVAALAFAGAAQAQSIQIKAGLWEHGYDMKSSDPRVEAAMKQMQQSMASLPPDQRKMMEDMMAKQGVGIGPKGNTVRVCMTQADVERGPGQPEPGCTQNARRNGNTWNVSFECKGPPPSSGEGQVTLVSPTAYQGQFEVRTVEDGKPLKMQMAQRGKWLGADCGKVKPITAR